MEGVIDRIEGGEAVILTGDGGKMYLPLSNLPAGVSEGSVLKFDIKVDKKAEAEKRKKIENLQKRLWRK